jgi:hypothetical protein
LAAGATATALPNTLGDTVSRCQALMGDRTGRWVTRAYIVPFINQAYSTIAKKIKLGSGKNFEGVVEILNVPIGTSDLSGYQRYSAPPDNTRGALVGLFDPLRMWVKTAGAPPQYYAEARGPRDTLSHVAPPGIQPGTFSTIVTWTWMGNKLLMTPVAGALDIQVYGRFNPPRLQKDEDVLLLYDDMTDTLAASACAMTGIERSNPEILKGWALLGESGVDDIVASIILQTQRNPRRLARLGGSGGSAWGWGSGSEI